LNKCIPVRIKKVSFPGEKRGTHTTQSPFQKEAVMTGAEIILKTAAQAGVEICFANPGTTELSLVAALDSPHRIRPVLGLFEGVCTGAADGYGRIREKPAMTLLHLGPGLANGIANLHNARRARTPVLNVVGEHTTWILPHDPPLNMDISMLAQTVPGWQKKSMAAGELSADTAEAVCASLYGQVSTLIVPADIQSASVGTVEIINKPFSFNPVDEEMIPHAVSMIKEASRPALILGGRTLRRKGLQAAAQIKAKSGCELIMMTFPSLFEAGASLPVLKRVPYFPGEAQKLLKHYDAFILVGTNEPTAFFGYAEGIISFLPPKAPRLRLDTNMQDAAEVLCELSAYLGPQVGAGELQPVLARLDVPLLPSGRLNAASMCTAIAALQPENCIVVEEGISSGAFYYTYSPYLKPYRHLTLTGGSIGIGMPLALGAALAEPGTQVINIQADGSAMYTLQALWTQAREKTKVITVICANRKYFTIELESLRAGHQSLGDGAKSLMNLTDPAPDWVSLSKGMGVAAVRTDTAESFVQAFSRALQEPGPFLIEAILE
jgi:acetolactate synthase-1/2/3 large subunit